MTKDEALDLALDWYDSGHEDREEFQAMIENLLATPVQEPVGRVCFEGDEVVWTDEPPESGTLLYTTPSAQPAFVQEPVADVYMAGSMKTNIGTNGRVVYVSTVYSEKPLVKGDKLYTAPPAAQRQWVGLTETEFEALHWKAKGYVATGLMDVVRMVEAKLKEKNT